MDFRKWALLGVAPLAGGALLLGSLLLRNRGPAKEEPAAKPKIAERPVYRDADKPMVIAQPAPRPAPAPEKTVAARSEDVRVRSTYQNYRTAVATQNSQLEQALRRVLLRDRDVCLAIAQEELARAQTDFERDVAQKVIENIRR